VFLGDVGPSRERIEKPCSSAATCSPAPGPESWAIQARKCGPVGKFELGHDIEVDCAAFLVNSSPRTRYLRL